MLEWLEWRGTKRRHLGGRRLWSQSSTRGGAALGALLIAVMGTGTAQASSSFGILARPARVIFEPGPPEAADRVQIQGLVAFAPPVSSPTVDFGAPTCGYLYFKCATGEEDLCREQWQEIAAASAAGTCVMFSARRDSTGALIDQGRVRPFSEAATAPGTYVASQGLGVSTIPCSGDLTTECPIPPSGSGGAGGGRSGGAGGGMAGGPGGGPAPGGAGGGGGTSGTAGQAGTPGGAATGGASSSGGASGTAGGPGSGGAPMSSSGGMGGPAGGASGTGGTSATQDAGTDATTGRKGGGGCSLTGETGPAAELLGVLGLAACGALAIVFSRARRRRHARGREP